MSTLPFETLSLIFGYLERRDWLQCQLTSKKWHEASTVFLYSKVTVNTLDKSRLYVNTLNNSSRLGEYLKTIDTENLFRYNRHTGSWDEHELLNTIIQQCPNLLNIRSKEPDISFWSRILYAATQGQLSRLQSLPGISGKSFETGVYTTLLFKTTLASIHLENEPENFTQLEAYQMLEDQMKEFKNLQMLHINYISSKQLSSFDELIENCLYLKELIIILIPVTIIRRVEKESGTLINNPRSDIKKLTINWGAILHDENQIRYLIQKFPALDCLNISFYQDHIIHSYLSIEKVVKLLRYAMMIPSFNIQLPLVTPQDLANIWIELINMNDMYKDILIVCYYLIHPPSGEVRLIKKEDKSSKITSVIRTNGYRLNFLNFFARVGKMVRSLRILKILEEEYPYQQRYYNSHDSLNENHIIEILESCPFLQTFELPVICNKSETKSMVIEHTGLAKLIIHNIYQFPATINGNLAICMSLSLPNLKRLWLRFNWCKYNGHDYYKTITTNISMPGTQLNVLGLELIAYPSCGRYDDRYKTIYIKFHSDSGVDFYRVDSTGLAKITEETYFDQPHQRKYMLAINCRRLKKLEIIREKESFKSYTF